MNRRTFITNVGAAALLIIQALIILISLLIFLVWSTRIAPRRLADST